MRVLVDDDASLEITVTIRSSVNVPSVHAHTCIKSESDAETITTLTSVLAVRGRHPIKVSESL